MGGEADGEAPGARERRGAAPSPDLEGRVCVVTGGTSGIGLATSLRLAQLNATVLIVGRNPRRCESACQRIRQQANSPVEYVIADLSSQKDVRRAAGDIAQRFPVIDVLVNNAGTYYMQRRLSVDGVEMTFAVNHLAPFLLTNLLRDALSRSPSARIVNVASAAHETGRIDFSDLQGEHDYDRLRAYSQSKLANVLFTYELARRLPGHVCANALHPGAVATNLGIDNGWLRVKARNVVRHRTLLTPEQGSRTSVYLASSPEVEGITGRYFVDCKEVPSSAASQDAATAARLWQVSEELTRSDGV